MSEYEVENESYDELSFDSEIDDEFEVFDLDTEYELADELEYEDYEDGLNDEFELTKTELDDEDEDDEEKVHRFANELFEILEREYESDLEREQAFDDVFERFSNEFFFKKLKRNIKRVVKRAGKTKAGKIIKQAFKPTAKITKTVFDPAGIISKNHKDLIKAGGQILKGNVRGAFATGVNNPTAMGAATIIGGPTAATGLRTANNIINAKNPQQAINAGLNAFGSFIPGLSNIPGFDSVLSNLNQAMPSLNAALPILSRMNPAFAQIIPQLNQTLPMLSSTIPGLPGNNPFNNSLPGNNPFNNSLPGNNPFNNSLLGQMKQFGVNFEIQDEELDDPATRKALVKDMTKVVADSMKAIASDAVTGKIKENLLDPIQSSNAVNRTVAKQMRRQALAGQPSFRIVKKILRPSSSMTSTQTLRLQPGQTIKIIGS